MRAWLLLIIVSLVVVVAACSSDERSPAPPVVAPASIDSPRVKPPADVAPRREGASAGFVAAPGGLITNGGTYESRVHADGAFEVTPRTARFTHARPLTLSTIAIARGARALDIRGTAAIDTGGSVVIRRGTILERIADEGTGIEQSWRFDRAPIGEGALVVRVRAAGQAYRTATDHGLHFTSEELGLRYGTATWIDAGGVRTTILPRFADGTIELVVPADVLQRSAFPAVLDPTITAEREVDQPATVTAAPGDQGVPALASLGPGQGYFAVWHDRRSIRPAFIGTRIASNGTVLDETGVIVANGVASSVPTPSLFASASGLLLVWSVSTYDQWQEPGLYAVRLDLTGKPLDPAPIAVVKGASNVPEPTGAFDGTNWLLSWSRYNSLAFSYEVLGVRVSAAGAVVDPAPVVLIAKNFGYSTRLVFDGANYFLVGNYGNTIQGQRLGKDLLPIGTTIGLTSTYSVYDFAAVWDGSRLHVVWFEYNYSSFTYSLLTRRFNALGQPLDGGLQTSLPTSGSYIWGTRTSWDGANLLVTWSNGSSFFGARVSPTGVLVDATAQSLATSLNYSTEYALASDGPGGLMAFREADPTGGTSNDVKASKVTASAGLTASASFDISKSANSETDPATAWNGSTYFSVWVDTRETRQTIWGAPIAADGTPGPAVKLLANPNGAISYNTLSAPRVASNGSTFLVTFAANQSGCPVGCVFRSVFTIVVDANGVVLGKVNDVLPQGGGTTSANTPDVAFNGTDYLVAYEEQTDGTGIAGRRVKVDGTPVDDKVLRLSPVTPGSSENRKTPSIASDGNRFFVAWQTTRQTSTGVPVGHIYGTRVENEGTPLDGELLICNAFLLQSSPRVAAHPARGFFVVWEDYRTSLDRADVYGGRIAPEGQLLDGDKGLAISAGDADESRPSVVASDDGTGWIVAWRDLRSKETYDVYAAWISATGANRDPKGFLFSAEGGDEETPALSAGPTGKLLLTYARLDPNAGYGSYRVRTRAIDAGKAIGQACTNSDDCASRACVDGFCCSTDCEGCGMCNATPGTCTPRAPNTDSPRCSYKCKGTLECPTECAESSDCATGSACDKASKKCVTRQICIDNKTLQDLTGKQTDCAPYTCVVDACRTSCTSVDDCASGFVCDQVGRCVPPPNAGDVAACSLSVPGSDSSSGRSGYAFAGAIGIVIAIASARRRSAR